ncbi:MAG: type II 3-dehydroquinate dehydratase, partial [Bacteroidota bacterium]
SFDKFYIDLNKKFPTISLSYFQSNVEGELINELHSAEGKFGGIIINAGGYTHTSIAIADAVAAINVPVIEVHISNIFSREDYRHVSYLGRNCVGSVSGFGLQSYELALQYFLNS